MMVIYKNNPGIYKELRKNSRAKNAFHPFLKQIQHQEELRKKYRVKNVSIDGVIKHLPLYMLEIILEQEPDIFDGLLK